MKRLIALLMAVCCLAGCASMPTGSGSIAQDNGERTEPFDEPYVRAPPVEVAPELVLEQRSEAFEVDGRGRRTAQGEGGHVE